MSSGATRRAPSPAPRGVIGLPAPRLQGSESDVEIQEISPRALTAGGGVDLCSAGGEYGQFCGGSRKADPHRRWEVLFRDSAANSQEDRPGFMFLHLQSMWATIRDEEGDILVGRYLQKDEFPKAGQILLIDGYRLIVLEQSTLGTQNKAPVSVPSRPSRFGGRFWVLANQEEETDEELGKMTCWWRCSRALRPRWSRCPRVLLLRTRRCCRSARSGEILFLRGKRWRRLLGNHGVDRFQRSSSGLPP